MGEIEENGPQGNTRSIVGRKNLPKLIQYG